LKIAKYITEILAGKVTAIISMEDKKMVYFLLACILFMPWSSYAQAVDSSLSCEAPAQIQQEISQANRNSVESLLQQYPNEFWVQRAYIDWMAEGSLPIPQGLGIPPGKVDVSVIERFRKNYESQSANPQAAYLYAYALIHTNTAKSVQSLEEITQKTPDFPLPWMTLGILYGYPDFRNPIKQRTYAESFLARCPGTLESRVASLALQLEKSDILMAYIKTLRERITGKAEDKYFPLYNYLWQLESKYALPAEQRELNKRIKDDLEFLGGFDGTTNRTLASTLMQGYQRIGDQAAIDALKAKEPGLAYLADMSAFTSARTEWSKANPSPPPDADLALRTAYLKKQIQFLDSWQSRMPENLLVLEPRFNALASLPDTSNDDLIHEGDRILPLLRRAGSNNLIAMKVLQTWAERNILLERIPSLVYEFKALKSRSSFSSGSAQQSDLSGGNYQALMVKDQGWKTDAMAWSILVRIYTGQGQIEQAKGVLDEWEKALEERRKEAEAIQVKQLSKVVITPTTASVPQTRDISEIIEASIVSGIKGDDAKFYEASAQLAAAEGRSLDALTFYQSSLRLMYGGNSMPPDFNEIEAGKTANGIWNTLGGSKAGWGAWLESIRTMPTPKPRSIARWTSASKEIPDFLLLDQQGKPWTLASFKGKATLINVWATWCGPCRLELPHLQKLYEQVKDRGDIQIVTLNIDEDQSLVEPFLKANNLSFPSLFAQSFVDKFAGKIGIPTTWISDQAGTIRMETLGFNGASPQWFEQTLKNIESVRSSAK
jgi:thiol-disulfide isomerase/thioredoxin